MDIQRAYLFASALGPIEFDTCLEETHKMTLGISTYPVEAGAPMIDHTYPNPRELTLRIAHGMTPLNAHNQQGQPMRLIEFYDLIDAARKSAQLLEVVTGIEIYQNMLIRSITILRDKQNTSTMALTVDLVESLQFTLSDIEEFARRYSDLVGVRQRAASRAERGKVQPAEIEAGTDEAKKNSSILYNMVIR